jgi:hypothetical protein
MSKTPKVQEQHAFLEKKDCSEQESRSECEEQTTEHGLAGSHNLGMRRAQMFTAICPE